MLFIRSRQDSTRTRRDTPRKSRRLSWTVPVGALECRQLLTTYSDVWQPAALTPRHAGPTNLYINFDGGTVPVDPVNNPKGPTETIHPFEWEAGDGSLNRERDIQQILFQV